MVHSRQPFEKKYFYTVLIQTVEQILESVYYLALNKRNHTMNQYFDTFYPKNSAEWREWLVENHCAKDSIWLMFYKKGTTNPSISWSEAVDEALCFGWIDSKKKPIDDLRYMQFFSKRKTNSTWSKINKEKIEVLIKKDLMYPAGMACIEAAKQNGSWKILDTVEALIIPEDLKIEFTRHPDSEDYFLSLSKSVRKTLLQWIVLAKREETRQKRVNEIAELAGRKQKPF